MASAVLAIVGCASVPEPSLVLDGPSEVRVQALGPVEEARVRLADGSEPDGVIWTVAHPEVVDIRANRVVAAGPGETEVVAEWEGERVRFTVIVALETELSFQRVPERLRVGEAHELSVVARIGPASVDVGRVDWATSDPAILTVDDGRVTAVTPGMAWVTARARGASAMAELEVVP